MAAADFDGDDYTDLAIGAPYESVGLDGPEIDEAGIAVIIYGSAADLNPVDFQLLADDDPEEFEHFGYAMTAGRLDPGVREDLVIGVPGQGLETSGPVLLDAGKLMVYVGTAGQLSAAGTLTQDMAGGTIEQFDQSGEVLTSGDLNGDDVLDIIIGVPEEDIGATQDAGAVFVFNSGLVSVDGFFTQADLAGAAVEALDQFGTALTTGDFNGDGFDDLAVGVPDEDVTALNSGDGIVHVIPGTCAELALASAVIWEQDDTLIATTEAGDNFGAALAAGDFNGDGYDDLVAGAPLEALETNTVAAAGAAVLLPGSSAGLTVVGAELWIQSNLASGAVEAGDRASESLHAADFNGDGAADLVLGAPAEDDQAIANAGAFQVFYTNQVIFRDGFESGTLSEWSSSSP